MVKIMQVAKWSPQWPWGVCVWRGEEKVFFNFSTETAESSKVQLSTSNKQKSTIKYILLREEFVYCERKEKYFFTFQQEQQQAKYKSSEVQCTTEVHLSTELVNLAARFDKYIGEFSNGMFEGNGTYYFNDGSR